MADRRRPRADAARDATGEADRLIDLAAGLYRDEMRRVVAWRHRIDSTTNWAVVLSASLLTWAFSSRDNPHYLLLLAIIAVAFFLVVEARRYRTYDIWRTRIRQLEANVFASAFDRDGAEERDWRQSLSRDLRSPAYSIGWLEGLQRRLRRIYFFLLALLGIAWCLRIGSFAADGETLLDAAAIGGLPGTVTVGAVGLFYLAALALLLWPLERQARERLEEQEGSSGDGGD